MSLTALDNMTNNDDHHAAIDVLKTEIQGLQELITLIGDDFLKAVDAIHSMKMTKSHRGRFIIAGIGKSGHVARKIAATLASTGTPAYYVHPGEASHGDMGMITKDDIVLFLSNSGENSEASDLIHYTRRHGITLLAMTSNADSTLATHADHVLLLPKAQEACPHNLAPTTSTTMMMAYGDALAIALLKKMDLTQEQYKVFHPGGKLGQKLMKISELMVPLKDLPIVDPDTTMDQAILVLSEKNLGSVIVVDANQDLMGIITDGDLKRHMAPDLLEKTVTEIMSTSPKTIAASSLVVEAMDVMTRTKGAYFTSLIVMDHDDNLVGMIRLQDCLQAGFS